LGAAQIAEVKVSNKQSDKAGRKQVHFQRQQLRMP